MFNKLQSLKSRTKIKFDENISDFYDEIRFAGRYASFDFCDRLSTKNAKDIAKFYKKDVVINDVSTG